VSGVSAVRGGNPQAGTDRQDAPPGISRRQLPRPRQRPPQAGKTPLSTLPLALGQCADHTPVAEAIIDSTTNADEPNKTIRYRTNILVMQIVSGQ